MKFTKSLKFKLTIWYSVILSFFCIAFVIGINIWLTNYMTTINTDSPNRRFFVESTYRQRMRALSEDQRTLLMESRLEDLENIRRISLFMVFPLVLLSFGGGYVLSSVFLQPLEDLNNEIKQKEAENLGKEIALKDTGDEVSELIKSFNRMSKKLSVVFESQKEFVENASHELKTPLSIIQANLDTALEDENISRKELNKILDSSKSNIRFMNSLTEDLLLLSVLDHNVEEGVVNLRKVLENVTHKLSNSAKRKDIHLELEVTRGKWSMVGNEILLERAFSNIVENSIKYSGGSCVTIHLYKEIDNIAVSIKDDGKGIPEEHLDKIFDRFYRVDRSRSRSSGGSGLGLAISREIIKKHDGVIEVSSESNKGVEFLITFSFFA